MVEFVLALPFLAGFLGLVFFFGWATMHKHQVLIANRYAAWRRIETGTWPTEHDLNRRMFVDRAAGVRLSGSQHDLRQTAADLAGEADSRHGLAGKLAGELVVSRFPAGQRAHVSASFDADTALWDRFTGPIKGLHGREGVTWRRDEVNCWGVLREQFYPGFDREMRSMPHPASGMGQTIRYLYLANWPARPGTLD